ncbi:hypothetical protein QCA50_014192 [Cerrena zonata]|uniref:Uncharacterized protein n=1 Tax=Cerrena zonata TaxID=2478898 RepID=A0AAW0FMD9_9APHY
MFPFASHGELGYDLEYAKEELKAAGDLAKLLGHRLTAHPGQFTQLASPKENVVDASVRELDYHCQMMRYMGLDQDSVIIIHMGGVYGDKEPTLARFKENYTSKLTDEMKARLVLENDEMCYNVDDLLPVCNELEYPHRFRLSPQLDISKCPSRLGNNPTHQRNMAPQRCYELPPELPDDMDLMIEAKDKEQAVFHLYRVYNLHPVIHENLRPEKPPKPFVRSPKKVKRVKGLEDELEEEGDGEGVNDKDGGVDGVGESRKKTRKRKARKSTDVAQPEADTLVGIAPPAPETSSKPSRKRVPKKATKDAETAVEEDTGPAVRLMNQEEYVQPVDWWRRREGGGGGTSGGYGSC